MRKTAVVVALMACAAAAAWQYLPLRYAVIAAVRGGNGCPPRLAWGIPEHKARLMRAKDEILEKSRLLQKEYEGLELYETPYGRFWAPPGSRYTLPFNLAEQAVHLYGAGAHFVQKGDIVLDCGANVGVFTRFALNAGASKVVAVEPAPDNVECLRRNFRDEIAAGRVLVVPKGVWDRADELELRIEEGNEAAATFVMDLKKVDRTVRVPLIRIDDLMEELGLPRVDFIKMDIEGAEVRALEGARETLRRHHPRLSIAVYHQWEHPVEVPRAARAAWPHYQVECGPCDAPEGRMVRPDVLYLR
ncbi:MAG: FkbM family methyltransferase [Bryobacteraceae bacterium]